MNQDRSGLSYFVAVAFAITSGILTQYHVYDYGPAVTFGLFSLGWFMLSACNVNTKKSYPEDEPTSKIQSKGEVRCP
jgi:hypothetical protein